MKDSETYAMLNKNWPGIVNRVTACDRMTGAVLQTMRLVDVGQRYALLSANTNVSRQFMSRQDHSDIVADVISGIVGRRLEVFVDPAPPQPSSADPPTGKALTWNP